MRPGGHRYGEALEHAGCMIEFLQKRIKQPMEISSIGRFLNQKGK